MVLKKVIILLFLPFFIISGCSSFSGKNGKVTHPTESNIPDDKELDFTISLNKSSTGQTQVDKKYKTRFTGGTLVGSFGKTTNSYDGIFGVKDIATDGTNYVFILPTHQKKIFVFNLKGKYLTTIGREGRGPGEFLRPVAIDVDEEGRLYVLDHTEIDIYSYQENSFKYLRPIKHRLSHKVDICIMNSKAYVSGYGVTETDSTYNSSESKYPMIISKPIHKFSIKKRKAVNTFGVLYKSASGWPIFTGNLSDTILACNDESNTVVGIFKKFPIIRGYSSSGEQKWTSMVTDFKYSSIIEENDNGMPVLKYEGSIKPHHAIAQFLSTKDSYTILQIENRISLPNKKLSRIKSLLDDVEPRIYSILINSETGEMEYLTKQMERFYALTNNYKIVKLLDKSIESISSKKKTQVSIFKMDEYNN